MVGPAAIRRTLPYLKSGGLVLREQVNVMEIHYNMYWLAHVTPNIGEPIDESKFTGPLKKYLPLVRSHGGLREFYFWEMPRLAYQNPNLQIVRFLEKEPLPFIRVWLNDGSDILFDCDNKDRKSILDQVIKILGDKSASRFNVEQQESAVTNINPATFGILRSRACMCDCPGQVPCPGLVSLPMGMRGKFTRYQTEKLEEWDNNPHLKLPTGPEMESHLVQWPIPIKPLRDGYVENLDKVFMRKPKQTTRPYQTPEELAKKFLSDRFEKESDRQLLSKYKPPKLWRK